MAIFGWKKGTGGDKGGNGEQPSAGNGGGAGDGEYKPQPEKARKWFDHARTYADTLNYNGALWAYANGIRLDPDAMSAHEAMLEVAIKYMNNGGKPAAGKEIRDLEEGGHPVARFAAAEFGWMKEVTNASMAIKALDAAVKAGQREYGKWAAPRILNIAFKQKKVSKSQMVQLKDLFREVEAWNEAIAALGKAKEIDPTDNSLDHEYKDLSAQRAMDQGGYDKAGGKEGGFRGFVKDSEKQRQLNEQDAIVTSQSADERNLARAKEAFEKTPNVPDVIIQYAQLVKKQGTPRTDELAWQIYMKGFETTGEYRFRMAAGDIRLEQARKAADALEAKGNPNAAEARRKQVDLEASEYEERIAKYPTNRDLKMRLGEIELIRGNLDNAMAQLQAAKDEPKLRVRAGHLLAKCFAAEGWHREAIDEYREALKSVEGTDKDRELSIRYDLMLSLLEEARKTRTVEMVREALDICSGIARKDITYRDIRNRRREIEDLQKSIGGG